MKFLPQFAIFDFFVSWRILAAFQTYAFSSEDSISLECCQDLLKDEKVEN
jgi:hypothetical protein